MSQEDKRELLKIEEENSENFTRIQNDSVLSESETKEELKQNETELNKISDDSGIIENEQEVVDKETLH